MKIITRENCENYQVFKHRILRNKDNSPLKARRNGKTEIWTGTKKFRIPIHSGRQEIIKNRIYQDFYIDQDNCQDWKISF